MLLRDTSSHWLLQSEPGFVDGPLETARLGERPVGLTACRDGSLLVADASNHRVRRIFGLQGIETLAGTGAKGQRDGEPLSASFSSPVALLEAESALIVLEENHPGTLRVIEEGT